MICNQSSEMDDDGVVFCVADRRKIEVGGLIDDPFDDFAPVTRMSPKDTI